MGGSPIIKTLDDMLLRLRDATQVLREAEKDVAQYTTAIRALIPVLEDDDIRVAYQLSLEELGGKPGFMDAVRSALSANAHGLTAPQVKQIIFLKGKLDLSGYSNAAASIHTTLRRLKDKKQVEERVNTNGEKVYRLLPGSPGVPLLNATERGLERLSTVGELRRQAKERAERGKK